MTLLLSAAFARLVYSYFGRGFAFFRVTCFADEGA